MAGAWRKAKMALGLKLKLCLNVPTTVDDASPSTGRLSDVTTTSAASAPMPPPIIASASGVRLSKFGSARSSKRICAICLGSMKAGQGHALFTAECSHVFHFHCIASSVKYGNQACPVCRAKWKDIPFPAPDLAHGRTRISPLDEQGRMTIYRPLPRSISSSAASGRRHHAHEPALFDDDEQLDPPLANPPEMGSQRSGSVEITTFPEFPALPRAATSDNFTILVHLKAPSAATTIAGDSSSSSPPAPAVSSSSRAPVDLVTVLDVSGSMAGTKLALLKRAMGFVIQHLGPSDRLSVIAFSSSARRLFPLRRMSAAGVQQALHAVNSLSAGGGTNIAEALRKALKVVEDRKHRNPVCSLILLSDGQDTYSLSYTAAATPPDHHPLLPRTGGAAVHAFGFGTDHDAALMHSISELSGGTFSFIEAEAAIQDAFAQCIGGLLSVVVQRLHVGLECVRPGTRIVSVCSGGYSAEIDDAAGRRRGSIAVGDLYADEERDFLVTVTVPEARSAEGETELLRVSCGYRDVVAEGREERIGGEAVRIRRPETVTEQEAALEVDRQRNRQRAAEAMAEARAAAERGELAEAVAVLERCRATVAESAAGRAGDGLSAGLEVELREMQERMASRQRYEASGRAYVLSGLSSHSWQRATTRGEPAAGTSAEEGSALVRDLYYQTPSMVDMLQRSQTFTLPRRPTAIRPARSFPARPSPR